MKAMTMVTVIIEFGNKTAISAEQRKTYPLTEKTTLPSVVFFFIAHSHKKSLPSEAVLVL